MRLPTTRKKCGTICAVFVLALATLMGCAALVLDVGRAVLAVQRCQSVADVSALGAASALPVASDARARALEMVTANNVGAPSGLTVTTEAGDVTIYPANTTGTGLGGNWENLGPNCSAVKVTCRAYVPYYFARVLNMMGVDCARSAVAASGPLGGTAIAPIWIYFDDGVYTPGVTYNVYEGKSDELKSFGMASYAAGSTTVIAHYLQGNHLTTAEILAASFSVGDILPVTNGNHGGAWKQGLDDSPDGRLYRANQAPYKDQTPDNFTWDNPRILIIPLLAGKPDTGSTTSAATIMAFGAFWIEGGKFTGNNTYMTGQFLTYCAPSIGEIDPMGGGSVTTRRLVLIQ